MQQMVSYIGHVPFSPPDVVAKAVLKAVTSENPSLRYLAGKDAEGWIGLKKREALSDEEFHKMMKQKIMK
jgi:hypothetical protein